MAFNLICVKFAFFKGWVSGPVRGEDGKRMRLQRDREAVDLGKYIKSMHKICMN
jgi:hypothetical protein